MALQSDRSAPILLNLGRTTLEAGLVGDLVPRVVENWETFATEQLFQLDRFDHLLDDHQETRQETLMANEITQFKFLFYDDLLVYRDDEDRTHTFQYCLRKHLIKVLVRLFDDVGVNIVNSKVILLESPFASDWFKAQVEYVLLKKLRVKSVKFLPSSAMALYGSGHSSGIVIDAGWSKITIEPIYDYRLLDNYSKFTKRAGMMLHYSSDEGLDCIFDNTDSDELSPVTLLSQMLSELPIDIRTDLASHVMFIGGLCNDPAFKAPFQSLPITEVQTPGSWAGASLYASTLFAKQPHGFDQMK